MFVDPRMAGMGRGRAMGPMDRMPSMSNDLMYQGQPVGGGFNGSMGMKLPNLGAQGMPPMDGGMQVRPAMEPPQQMPPMGGANDLQSKPWAEPPQRMPPEQGGGGIQAFKPMEPPQQMPPWMGGGGIGPAQKIDEMGLSPEMKQAITGGMPPAGIKAMLEGGGGPMGMPTTAGGGMWRGPSGPMEDQDAMREKLKATMREGRGLPPGGMGGVSMAPEGAGKMDGRPSLFEKPQLASMPGGWKESAGAIQAMPAIGRLVDPMMGGGGAQYAEALKGVMGGGMKDMGLRGLGPMPGQRMSPQMGRGRMLKGQGFGAISEAPERMEQPAMGRGRAVKAPKERGMSVGMRNRLGV
jgi:hypothetical protein